MSTIEYADRITPVGEYPTDVSELARPIPPSSDRSHMLPGLVEEAELARAAVGHDYSSIRPTSRIRYTTKLLEFVTIYDSQRKRRAGVYH